MTVVDASAVLAVLVGGPDERLAARLADEPVLHAPHLLDTEVLHALRRLDQRGEISARHADDARSLFAQLTIHRYPHAPLSDRVWQLRANLTAYDATYVALAEGLELPLVTTDGRLARSCPGGVVVETF